jgi:tripartite-type tricarboxylate transporter receptor subunit TctC
MTHVSTRHAVALAAALLCAASFTTAAQEKYPSKPVRLLVPFSAGSQIDILGRWIGEKLGEKWGQQVVIDNRPSAGGTIASEYVVRANPDGHTLMMVSIGHAGNATLYQKLPYSIVKDFSGISQVASSANVLVVPTAVGVRSVKDLIELAKSTPGKLNYSSAGIGSGSHMNAEMFKLATGIDVVHVPYKGAPEAINNIIANRVQFLFSPVLVSAPHIKSGRVVAVAVSTAARSPLFPDVPTAAESGVPGFDFDQWYGMITSAKVPRPLVRYLNEEVVRILNMPDMRERMLTQGVTPRLSTPEEFDAFIQSEVKNLARVLTSAGSRAD